MRGLKWHSSPPPCPVHLPLLPRTQLGLQGVVVRFGGVCFPTARWAKQAHAAGLADDALRELYVVPYFYRVSL